jgi:hypothetical protein
MSRNLGYTACKFCDGDVRTSEAPRPITTQEAVGYFHEFEGMLVARAACVDCEAPYLAWVDQRTCVRPPHGCRPESFAQFCRSGESHFDLSHYHAFNDEPAYADLPAWRIEVVRQRRPAPRCYWCNVLMHNGHCFDHTCPGWRLPSP